MTRKSTVNGAQDFESLGEIFRRSGSPNEVMRELEARAHRSPFEKYCKESLILILEESLALNRGFGPSPETLIGMCDSLDRMFGNIRRQKRRNR